LCLVDDFGGELMKGDAEGRKQQKKRNAIMGCGLLLRKESVRRCV